MTEPIAIEYELLPEDFRDFSSFHSKRSPLQRRARRRFQFVVPAVWLGMFLLDGLTAAELVLWGAGSALWMGFVPLFYRWATRRHAKRMAEQGIARGFIGPHRLIVDERGIVDATPFSETRLFWPAIEEVVDVPGLILLYTGGHSAVIVPKRAFVSELAAGTFVESMGDLLRRTRASGELNAG